MNRLALQVQQALGRDPHGGDLHVLCGCLWIYGTDACEPMGFTMRGIESLKQLTADQKRSVPAA